MRAEKYMYFNSPPFHIGKQTFYNTEQNSANSKKNFSP